jgi:hypothetical protein
MGVSLRIAALVAVLAAATAATTVSVAAPADRGRRAFRCPAPVPVVGDVRRREVDTLFFTVMRNAEAAGRMPTQADVDAALVETQLAARAQPDTYTMTNVLLYTLTPGATPGFRAGFYTGETWGYTIEQRTLDTPPVVTDSEATYRHTGGDLAAVDAAYDVARGSATTRFRAAAVLVRDARRRGVNDGRVAVLATATAVPRTGWIGVHVDRSRRTVVVRGRTCSKIVDRIEASGVERLAVSRRRVEVSLVCPRLVLVPVATRRAARRLYDAAMAHALTATPPRASPDATDVAAAIASTGIDATDATDVPTVALGGGLHYVLGSDRFGVVLAGAAGSLYRADWVGLDLPVLVREGNASRDLAASRFAAAVDDAAFRLRRHGGRFAPVTHPLRSPRSLPRSGVIGVWLSADRRSAVVRGRLCGRVATAYPRT